VTVDCLTGLLSHLKPDGLAGFVLAYGRTIDSVTMRSNVLHPQADGVASSELATDGRLNMARSRVRLAICSLVPVVDISVQDAPDARHTQQTVCTAAASRVFRHASSWDQGISCSAIAAPIDTIVQ
jgi:hypothetical protein